MNSTSKKYDGAAESCQILQARGPLSDGCGPLERFEAQGQFSAPPAPAPLKTITTPRERWQAVMQAAIDGALDAGVTPDEIQEDFKLEIDLQKEQRPPVKRARR